MPVINSPLKIQSSLFWWKYCGIERFGWCSKWDGVFFPHPLFTLFSPFKMTCSQLLSSSRCGKHELILPKGTVMSLSVDWLCYFIMNWSHLRVNWLTFVCLGLLGGTFCCCSCFLLFYNADYSWKQSENAIFSLLITAMAMNSILL